MFYILILSGITFIILGMFFKERYGKINVDFKDEEFIDEVYNENMEILRKNINSNKVEASEDKSGNDEVLMLERRLEQLEKMLFKQMLEKETSKPIFAEDKKQAKEVEKAIEKDALDNYHLIAMYEKQGKSLDEIAALLEMNKGEVILLKNLYKNS